MKNITAIVVFIAIIAAASTATAEEREESYYTSKPPRENHLLYDLYIYVGRAEYYAAMQLVREFDAAGDYSDDEVKKLRKKSWAAGTIGAERLYELHTDEYEEDK